MAVVAESESRDHSEWGRTNVHMGWVMKFLEEEWIQQNSSALKNL